MRDRLKYLKFNLLKIIVYKNKGSFSCKCIVKVKLIQIEDVIIIKINKLLLKYWFGKIYNLKSKFKLYGSLLFY